jgi:hypothetical protein
MMKWSQFGIIRGTLFADVGFFCEKRGMFCLCPETYVNHGIGVVQTLHNGKGEKKIPEGTLVNGDYFPGLSRLKGTHELCLARVSYL